MKNLVYTTYLAEIKYLLDHIRKYLLVSISKSDEASSEKDIFSFESTGSKKGGHPNFNIPCLAPGIGWWCKGGTRLWVAVAQGAAKTRSLTLLEVTKRQQK